MCVCWCEWGLYPSLLGTQWCMLLRLVRACVRACMFVAHVHELHVCLLRVYAQHHVPFELEVL